MVPLSEITVITCRKFYNIAINQVTQTNDPNFYLPHVKTAKEEIAPSPGARFRSEKVVTKIVMRFNFDSGTCANYYLFQFSSKGNLVTVFVTIFITIFVTTFCLRNRAPDS